jgi:hypothetical protein
MNELRIDDFVFYNHERPDAFDTWMARLDYYATCAVATFLPQFAMGIMVVAQPRLASLAAERHEISTTGAVIS